MNIIYGTLEFTQPNYNTPSKNKRLTRSTSCPMDFIRSVAIDIRVFPRKLAIISFRRISSDQKGY